MTDAHEPRAPATPPADEVERLLARAAAGDDRAMAELMPLLQKVRAKG